MDKWNEGETVTLITTTLSLKQTLYFLSSASVMDEYMRLNASCAKIREKTPINRNRHAPNTDNAMHDNPTLHANKLLLWMRSRHEETEETSELYNGTGRVDSLWPREWDEGCLLHLKTTSAPDSTMSESLFNEEVCSWCHSAAIYSAKEASGSVRVMEPTYAEGFRLLELLLHHLNQIYILSLVQ